MACHNLGSPIIDGIFLAQKMCIYSSVMIITTVLITRGPVQWRGQLVMHHVYINKGRFRSKPIRAFVYIFALDQSESAKC